MNEQCMWSAYNLKVTVCFVEFMDKQYQWVIMIEDDTTIDTPEQA